MSPVVSLQGVKQISEQSFCIFIVDILKCNISINNQSSWRSTTG